MVFRDTQINKFSSIMFHRKDAESPFVSWFDHWPCSDFGSDFEVQPQDLIKVARAAVRLSHAKGPPLPVDSMCQQSQALAEHMPPLGSPVALDQRLSKHKSYRGWTMKSNPPENKAHPPPKFQCSNFNTQVGSSGQKNQTPTSEKTSILFNIEIWGAGLTVINNH